MRRFDFEMHPVEVGRKKIGFSRNKFARTFGENSGYVTHVERFDRPLSVPAAFKYAKILKVDPIKLHYDSLLAYMLKRAFDEWEPDDANKYTVLIAIEKICKAKHEFLITEYLEHKRLEKLYERKEVI